MKYPAINDTAKPATSPIKLIKIASFSMMPTMYPREAPIAFKIPISRVLSVMVVYIASITTSALTTAASPTSTRRKVPR